MRRGGVLKSQLGRDYLWNTAASVMSSASFVLMFAVASRTLTIGMAGLFSFAFGVGQQFQTLGMYEVRAYHVTDVRRRFSFGMYLSTRIVTTIAMLLGIILAAVIRGGPLEYTLLIILIASTRVYDALEDVFYSEFQRSGRLDIGGRASFARIFTTTLTFCLVLFISADLLVSTVATLVVTFVVFNAVFLPPARRHFGLSLGWDRSEILLILRECLPLFLASFAAIYVSNAPKYAIEHYLDSAAQAYFAIIFMPAVVINMLSLLVFRPLLTRMATYWTDGDFGAFRSLVRRGLYSTAGAFVLVAIVTWLVGAPLLKLVFAQDVSHLMPELLVLIGAGALNAANVILYYALATMRRQKLLFVGYLITVIVITVLLIILVPLFALMGTAIAYGGAMTVLAGVFAFGVLRPNMATRS